MNPCDSLPTDPDSLRALLLAERTHHAQELERLTAIIRELQRHRFGRRAERLDPEQLALALEDVEQTLAAADAAAENDSTARKQGVPRRRQINRGALPPHLPREEIIIDVADKTCACCGSLKHRIGEDVSERLDVMPAQFKVIVTRRPKYACQVCAGEVVQAPAPERLIENGIPTEALVAHVLIAKYADHTPLYRQAQIYARQGITLDRSTLADWVGRAAFTLRPVHTRLLEQLKQSTKLFADETTAPVLDPGRGRVKKGQLWAYARDERLGPATLRQAWPMSMRPTASMRGRPSTSQDSAASCRSMATVPMRNSLNTVTSRSLSVGATCAGSSTRSR
jgi:transposase